MAKEYKPGFVYIRSEILNQEIAWSKKTGFVYCEDKVQYSKKEIDILEAAGAEITLADHTVKKVFGGEIVKVERKYDANSAGECPTGKGEKSPSDDSHSSGEVQGASGNGEVYREGELDIY